jgi:hypothetical protein
MVRPHLLHGGPRYRRGWVYVAEARFTSPRISAHVVPAALSATIAGKTTNVTNYARVGGSIVNRSIDVGRLQAATGQAIKPVRLLRAEQPLVGDVAGTPNLQALPIYQPMIVPELPALQASPPRLNLELDKKSMALPAPGPYLATLPSTALPPPAASLPTVPGPSGLPEPPALGGVGGLPVGVIGGLKGKLGK